MKHISKPDLVACLDQMAQSSCLIAPRSVDGVLLYRPVQQAGEIVWEYIRPVLSIREYFFPQTEHMLRIEKIGNEIRLTETLPEQKLVIFGVRPCDARGLLALDALFLESPPVDTYYARRRENTTLIGLACEYPGSTCFCTRMGGALDDPRGMDVMIYPQDEEYGIRAVTAKGQALLITWGIDTPIEPVSAQEAEAKIPAIDKWPPHFMDNFWQQFSERCLSCRACSYVCPTCYCFDIRDYPNKGKSDRVRSWESCQSAGFTKIAGGHDPRANKGIRMRQRFAHKLLYFPEEFGVSHCIGCGRCVKSCPVNIDIREIITDVQKLGAKGE